MNKQEIVVSLLKLSGENVEVNSVCITNQNKLRVFFKGKITSLDPNGFGDSYIGTIILGEKSAYINLIGYLGDELSYTYHIGGNKLYISKKEMLIKEIELAEKLNLTNLTLEKTESILKREVQEEQVVKKRRFKI